MSWHFSRKAQSVHFEFQTGIFLDAEVNLGPIYVVAF